jgi:DNA-binding MarR family transcriptional regulator
MIQRGLIERVPGPGRAVRHRLTDKGRGLREAGDAIVERVLRDSFATLTPAELDALDSILMRVLDQPDDTAAVAAAG